MEDEDKELPQLKALYDELWSDARTMIKDMNRSIYMYSFASFMALVLSVIMIGTAISDWIKVLLGNASTLTFFYAIVGTLGSVLYVIFGVIFLYWYNKLRKRYSRLIQMEKTIRG